MMYDKPKIAIPAGDPAGVGPEVIAGIWQDPQLHQVCAPVVIGHPEVMRRAAALRCPSVRVIESDEVDPLAAGPTALPCLSIGQAAMAVEPGVVDPRGGQAAFESIRLATELALAGTVDAITTAPLNKQALVAAGHNYPGHTELLADLCNVDEVAMMLHIPNGGAVKGRAGLGVVHVTLHVALQDVFGEITVENVLIKARLADQVMRKLSPLPAAPRIGIAALNPHAGEAGLFGKQEQEVLRPAVERGLQEQLLLTGPLPCDTLMVRAAAGEFDAVVAMYHDQGHIALKLLDMHRAVNITLGLPIVRTSVAHGTAFDLAWKGQAETRGMLEAIRVAAQLVPRGHS